MKSVATQTKSSILASASQSLSKKLKGQKPESDPKDKVVVEIPLADIDLTKQPRKVFKGIEDLAKTIEENGLLQPIVVQKISEKKGRYELVAGERRYRAHQHLGRSTIEAYVREVAQTTAQLRDLQLIENLQREDLDPMEISIALNEYLEEGLTQQDVARRLGYSRQWVTLHVGLANLPNSVKELYEEDVVKDPNILQTLRKLNEIDPGRCEVLCKKALESGISRSEADQAYRDAKATMAKLEAEKNRPKEMSIGNQEQAADALFNADLKAAGLDDKGEGESAGLEEMDGDRIGEVADVDDDVEPPDSGHKASSGTDEDKVSGDKSDEGKADKLKQYEKTEPAMFQLKVKVGKTEPYEGIIMNDRLDNNPEFIWVKRFVKGGKTEYHREHCSEVELICVI